MAFTFNRPPKGPKKNISNKADLYVSMGLPLFVEHLEHSPDTQLLDVGPACGNNINFFAGRIKKLYISDLFLPLDRRQRQKKTFDQIWQNIDYPDETFDAIQLWTLGDFLEDEGLIELVKKCRQLLKPGGLLMLTAQSDHAESKKVRVSVIDKDFQISWRHLPQLNLTFTYRHNHDIIDKLKPLTLVKSFIYRNGIREFLFRKD